MNERGEERIQQTECRHADTDSIHHQSSGEVLHNTRIVTVRGVANGSKKAGTEASNLLFYDDLDCANIIRTQGLRATWAINLISSCMLIT